MRISSNPGRWLLLEGSLELGADLFEVTEAAKRADFPGPVIIVDGERYLRERPFYVRDLETGARVTLADLLRSFLIDPVERVTGPVRITIEAGP